MVALSRRRLPIDRQRPAKIGREMQEIRVTSGFVCHFHGVGAASLAGTHLRQHHPVSGNRSGPGAAIAFSRIPAASASGPRRWLVSRAVHRKVAGGPDRVAAR